ncbi:MAG TPA: c-type cytochrome [Anaerolineales bacterium]|jgi:mono/diheme cytochrome c family protein
MKSRIILLSAVLALLLSACTLSLAEDITPPPNYQSPTPGPTMSPLFPQNPPSLASGAAIFVEKCAPCHGDRGLGDGPNAGQLQTPPTALGKPEIGRMAAPANWYTTVTQGKINSFMPPFTGSLDDQQRWDVVAYAISLGGSTSAEAEKGKSVYEANCVKCHGPTGNAVESANFTDQALMAKLTQTDIGNFVNKGVGKMPGFGGLIPDADIFAVAAYVRTFSVIAGTDLASAASATPPAPQATSTPDTAVTPAGDGTQTADATVVANTTPEVTSAPTAPVGNITGKITNGSGGSVPTDLKVTLHIYEHDTATKQFNEVSKQDGSIAADGAYKFEQVPLLTNHAFFVSVDFANTVYESDPVFPTDGQTSLDMPLTIYDTTTDTSALVADQVHILLDYSQPDIIQVVEFLIISNPGTKSVVAAEKGGAVVKVTLPAGYTNLQFDQGAIGDRYLKTSDGFADTTSVAPGTNKYQIVFAVDLPLPKAGLFGGRKFELNQPFPFKVNGLSVLAPEGVSVSGSNVTPGGLQDMGTGAKYQVFNAGSLEAGKSLQVTASGAPLGTAQAATSVNPNQNIIIGVGAFGLVLIIAGIWMYWRERQRANVIDDDEEIDEEETDNDGDGASMEEIMDAIVALDDQFKSGNIQEAAYKVRRAELKAKLKSTL